MAARSYRSHPRRGFSPGGVKKTPSKMLLNLGLISIRGGKVIIRYHRFHLATTKGDHEGKQLLSKYLPWFDFS